MLIAFGMLAATQAQAIPIGSWNNGVSEAAQREQPGRSLLAHLFNGRSSTGGVKKK